MELKEGVSECRRRHLAIQCILIQNQWRHGMYLERLQFLFVILLSLQLFRPLFLVYLASHATAASIVGVSSLLILQYAGEGKLAAKAVAAEAVVTTTIEVILVVEAKAKTR